MNNGLDVFELGEVNPPTYASKKREVEGSLAIAKPGKKIKTTNTDMDIRCSNHLVVDINDLRFIFDLETPHWITVQSCTDGENFKYMDEIDEDFVIGIHTLEQLKVVVLNWYFNNVEVVNEIK